MEIKDILMDFNSKDESQRWAIIDGIPPLEKYLEILKKAMGDNSWRVRKAAVDKLISIKDRKKVITTAISCLSSHDNAGLRNSSVEALIRIGPTTLSYLYSKLATKDTDVRKFVVDIIGEIGVEESVPYLIKRLDDEDDNIRFVAAEALGKIGSKDAIASLKKALKGDDMMLKFSALEALGSIGSTVPLMSIEDCFSDPLLRKASLKVLANSKSKNALDMMIDSLMNDGLTTKMASARSLIYNIERFWKKKGGYDYEVLEKFSSFKGHPGVQYLISLLEAEDIEVRRSVSTILGWMGDERAISPLLKLALEEETEDIAISSILSMGRNISGQLKVLLDESKGKSKGIILYIASRLNGKDIMNEAYNGLSDRDIDIRYYCALALGEVGGANAIKPLFRCLKSPEKEIQDAVVNSLLKLGYKYENAIMQEIVPLFSSPLISERRHAVTLLGALRNKKRINYLKLALKDVSPEIRKSALYALKGCKMDDVLDHISVSLTDESADVRSTACIVITGFKGEKVRRLLKLALNDKDPWVRVESIKGLSRLSGKRALKDIEKGLGDMDTLVVITAFESFLEIEGAGAFKRIPSLIKCANDEAILEILKMLKGYPRGSYVSKIGALKSHPSDRVRQAINKILNTNP